MPSLSEKLADLAVRVGDVEARAEAFCFEQLQVREQKVEEMRGEIRARKDKLESTVQAANDGISSAWNTFIQSTHDRAEQVRAQIEAKKGAMELERAQRRAERLQHNAILAIDYATLVMEETELAVAEAFQAQIHAGELAERETAR